MQSLRPQILICAPGAGLGHLIRACTLLIRLAERGLAGSIVTNSPYAEGLSRLTGCAIDRLPDRRWKHDLRDYVTRPKPRLVVLDTFPFGLRGEWSRGFPKDVRVAYLARRLNVFKYLEAVGARWEPGAPQLARVIAAEPLSEEHEARLKESGSEVLRLPGRIRLPDELLAPPVPARLAEMLAAGRPWLVVHSGPERELRLLLARAREEREKRGVAAEIAVIASRPALGISEPVFEYFPAARLFTRAGMIVGGAGYNLVAETARFPEKRLLVPFARKYDDQAGRLADDWPAAEDGGPAAAGRIVSWL